VAAAAVVWLVRLLSTQQPRVSDNTRAGTTREGLDASQPTVLVVEEVRSKLILSYVLENLDEQEVLAPGDGTGEHTRYHHQLLEAADGCCTGQQADLDPVLVKDDPARRGRRREQVRARVFSDVNVSSARSMCEHRDEKSRRSHQAEECVEERLAR
jgi:hypothetical protein